MRDEEEVRVIEAWNMFLVVVSVYPMLMWYPDLRHDLLFWGCLVFRLMLTEHV